VDLTERLRSWTYRRQALGRAGREPLEVLRSIVGVYSTHPTAPLALLARCAGLQPKEFTDMEQRRQVVRLPAMRQSAFLLPTDTAERVFAATRVPLEKHAGRLRFGGLTFDAYARLTPRVVECLTTPSTPAELRRCFPTQDDVYMVARVLAREGKVLRVGGSLRTDQLKYVATEAWLGRPLDDVDPHEALTWLAAEYLRAFGPARAADFAWWAGTTRRAASAALAQLETTEREHGLVMLEEDQQREAFDHVQPVDPEAVDVLPKWDSYTMAYAPGGRQRLVDDRFLSCAYTSVAGSPGATAGDGLPLVLRSGCAIASWSHRFEGNRLTVTVAPFEGQRLPDGTFDAIGQLLSASSISVGVTTQA
jgi:Winged helix DNA-binding domain